MNGPVQFKCDNPTLLGEVPRNCGKCLWCRKPYARNWVTRMQLEAMVYEPCNAFVTLTYDDDHLPRSDTGVATLDREDWRLFIKRLRINTYRKWGLRIRFFMCGEYGERLGRPHYHAILFGFPPCQRAGGTMTEGSGRRPVAERCCDVCRMLHASWGKGNILCGTCNEGSIGYVGKYLTKLHEQGEESFVVGRLRQFKAQSSCPALGSKWIYDYFLPSLVAYPKAIERHIFETGDVPKHIRLGGRRRYLGRTLISKVRKGLGRDVKTPREVIEAYTSEFDLLRLEARELMKPSDDPGGFIGIYTELLRKSGLQAKLNIEARENIDRSRKLSRKAGDRR